MSIKRYTKKHSIKKRSTNKRSTKKQSTKKRSSKKQSTKKRSTKKLSSQVGGGWLADLFKRNTNKNDLQRCEEIRIANDKKLNQLKNNYVYNIGEFRQKYDKLTDGAKQAFKNYIAKQIAEEKWDEQVKINYKKGIETLLDKELGKYKDSNLANIQIGSGVFSKLKPKNIKASRVMDEEIAQSDLKLCEQKLTEINQRLQVIVYKFQILGFVRIKLLEFLRILLRQTQKGSGLVPLTTTLKMLNDVPSFSIPKERDLLLLYKKKSIPEEFKDVPSSFKIPDEYKYNPEEFYNKIKFEQELQKNIEENEKELKELREKNNKLKEELNLSPQDEFNLLPESHDIDDYEDPVLIKELEKLQTETVAPSVGLNALQKCDNATINQHKQIDKLRKEVVDRKKIFHKKYDKLTDEAKHAFKKYIDNKLKTTKKIEENHRGIYKIFIDSQIGGGFFSNSKNKIYPLEYYKQLEQCNNELAKGDKQQRYLYFYYSSLSWLIKKLYNFKYIKKSA